MIDLAGLEELQGQVEQAREQMRKSAKKLVKDGTKQIFEEYGDIIEKFGWTQYTPYFNDGDECIFGMHGLSIVAKEDGEDLREDWPYEGSDSFSTYGRGKIANWRGDKGDDFDQRYQDAYDACQTVYKALSMDDSLAKDIFGDHSLVVFTAEGVEVEEYSHD